MTHVGSPFVQQFVCAYGVFFGGRQAGGHTLLNAWRKDAKPDEHCHEMCENVVVLAVTPTPGDAAHCGYVCHAPLGAYIYAAAVEFGWVRVGAWLSGGWVAGCMGGCACARVFRKCF